MPRECVKACSPCFRFSRWAKHLLSYQFSDSLIECPSGCPSRFARDLFFSSASHGHLSTRSSFKECLGAHRFEGLRCAPCGLAVILRPSCAELRVRKRIAISRVGSWEWSDRRPLRSEPPPARPPEPTSTSPAERFERSVGIENLNAVAGHRVAVEEGLVLWVPTVGAGHVRPRK